MQKGGECASGAQIMKCKVELLAGLVRVTLEQGKDPKDIVPVLSSAAEIARANRLQNLLVISGLDDPANTEAVSTALEQIHALSVPLPFKIAFVAVTLPQYSIYHFAEGYAQRFGITAKVLASDRDAKEWLGVRERSLASVPQVAARQEAITPLSSGAAGARSRA